MIEAALIKDNPRNGTNGRAYELQLCIVLSTAEFFVFWNANVLKSLEASTVDFKMFLSNFFHTDIFQVKLGTLLSMLNASEIKVNIFQIKTSVFQTKLEALKHG